MNKYKDRYNRLWFVSKVETHRPNDKAQYYSIWQSSKHGLALVKELLPNSYGTKSRSYAQNILDNFAKLQGWNVVRGE